MIHVLHKQTPQIQLDCKQFVLWTAKKKPFPVCARMPNVEPDFFFVSRVCVIVKFGGKETVFHRI